MRRGICCPQLVIGDFSQISLEKGRSKSNVSSWAVIHCSCLTISSHLGYSVGLSQGNETKCGNAGLNWTCRNAGLSCKFK